MNGGQLGSVTFRLVTDASDFDRGISSAESAAHGLQNTLGATASKASGVSGVLKSVAQSALAFGSGFVGAQAVVGGFNQIVGLVKGSIIGLNATMETSELQFQTLFAKGDTSAAGLATAADKAHQHIADLFQFAKVTPFETQPIINASRLLQTFGGDALDSMENLQLVGDTAAGVNDDIADLSFWIGRAYAAIKGGQPFGEAAMRLQELAVLTPETRQKMEALQKSGADSSAVWGVFTDQLKNFTGAMQRQATTWAGVTSTFSDTVSLLSARAFKPLFGLLRDSLYQINNFLGSDKFAAVADVIAGVINGIVVGLKKLPDVIARTLSPMMRGFTPVLSMFTEMRKGAILLYEYLHLLFTDTKTGTYLFSLFSPQLKGVATAINFLVKVGLDLRDIFVFLIKQVLPPLWSAFQFGINLLSDMGKGLINLLKPMLDLVPPLGGIVDNLGMFSDKASFLTKQLGPLNVAARVVATVIAIMLAEMVVSQVLNFASSITTLGKTLVSFPIKAAQGIATAMKAIVEYGAKPVKFVISMVGEGIDFLKNLPFYLKYHVSTFEQFVKRTGDKLIEDFKDKKQKIEQTVTVRTKQVIDAKEQGKSFALKFAGGITQGIGGGVGFGLGSAIAAPLIAAIASAGLLVALIAVAVGIGIIAAIIAGFLIYKYREQIKHFFTDKLWPALEEAGKWLAGKATGIGTAVISAIVATFTDPKNFGRFLGRAFGAALVVALLPFTLPLILYARFKGQIDSFLGRITEPFKNIGGMVVGGIVSGLENADWALIGKIILTYFFPPAGLIFFHKQAMAIGETVVSGIGDGVMGAVGFLGTVLGVIAGFFTQLPSMIGGALQPVPSIVLAIFTSIPGIVASIFTSIPVIIGAVLGALPVIASRGASGVVLSFEYPFTTLPGQISGVFGSIFDYITGWVGLLAGWLSKSIDVWGWVKQGFIGFYEGVKDVLGLIFGSGYIPDWVGRLAAWMIAHINPWSWITGAWHAMWGGITGVLSGVTGSIGDTLKAWTQLPNLFDIAGAFLGPFKTISKEIGGILGGISSTITGWVGDIAGKAGSAAKSGWDKFSGAVSGLNPFGGLGGPASAEIMAGHLKSPAPGATITQGFGVTDFSSHYASGQHTGIDFAAPIGTPIYAIEGGTISNAGWNGGYGNEVSVQSGDGYTEMYGHMSKILAFVGEKIVSGQEIGLVGSTGNSTGPHVHFEVRNADGAAINPSFMLGAMHGTQNWRGGPLLVGEGGPEVVRLPRGADVYPNYALGGIFREIGGVQFEPGSGSNPANEADSIPPGMAGGISPLGASYAMPPSYAPEAADLPAGAAGGISSAAAAVAKLASTTNTLAAATGSATSATQSQATATSTTSAAQLANIKTLGQLQDAFQKSGEQESDFIQQLQGIQAELLRTGKSAADFVQYALVQRAQASLTQLAQGASQELQSVFSNLDNILQPTREQLQTQLAMAQDSLKLTKIQQQQQTAQHNLQIKQQKEMANLKTSLGVEPTEQQIQNLNDQVDAEIAAAKARGASDEELRGIALRGQMSANALSAQRQKIEDKLQALAQEQADQMKDLTDQQAAETDTLQQSITARQNELDLISKQNEITKIQAKLADATTMSNRDQQAAIQMDIAAIAQHSKVLADLNGQLFLMAVNAKNLNNGFGYTAEDIERVREAYAKDPIAAERFFEAMSKNAGSFSATTETASGAVADFGATVGVTGDAMKKLIADAASTGAGPLVGTGAVGTGSVGQVAPVDLRKALDVIGFQPQGLAAVPNYPGAEFGMAKQFLASLGIDAGNITDKLPEMTTELENVTRAMGSDFGFQLKQGGLTFEQTRKIAQKFGDDLVMAGNNVVSLSTTVAKFTEQQKALYEQYKAQGQTSQQAAQSTIDAGQGQKAGTTNYGFDSAQAAKDFASQIAGASQDQLDALRKIASGQVKLAGGGIITTPLHALIGESGPEAVLPLDDFYKRLHESLLDIFDKRPDVPDHIDLNMPPIQIQRNDNGEPQARNEYHFHGPIEVNGVQDLYSFLEELNRRIRAANVAGGDAR